MKVGLDLTDVNSNGGFDDFLPAGNYTSRVISAEVIETKAGHAIKVSFAVTRGEHEGSQISHFMNINHTNIKCTRMNKSFMKKLMEVGGHANPGELDDTDELLGLMVNVRISTKTDGQGYDVNEVEGYSKVIEGSAGAMRTAQTAQKVVDQVFPGKTVEPVNERVKFPWEK